MEAKSRERGLDMSAGGRLTQTLINISPKWNEKIYLFHKRIVQASLFMWWYLHLHLWRRGVVIITTAQLHSTKPEPRFCAGSNPPRGVSEIHDGDDLWQWSWLEISLNAFRRSTIPQKQFIIIKLLFRGILRTICYFDLLQMLQYQFSQADEAAGKISASWHFCLCWNSYIWLYTNEKTIFNLTKH